MVAAVTDAEKVEYLAHKSTNPILNPLWSDELIYGDAGSPAVMNGERVVMSWVKVGMRRGKVMRMVVSTADKFFVAVVVRVDASTEQPWLMVSN